MGFGVCASCLRALEIERLAHSRTHTLLGPRESRAGPIRAAFGGAVLLLHVRAGASRGLSISIPGCPAPKAILKSEKSWG